MKMYLYVNTVFVHEPEQFTQILFVGADNDEEAKLLTEKRALQITNEHFGNVMVQRNYVILTRIESENIKKILDLDTGLTFNTVVTEEDKLNFFREILSTKIKDGCKISKKAVKQLMI